MRYVLGLALLAILTIAGHAALGVIDHRRSVAFNQSAIASETSIQAQAALGDALLLQASGSERSGAAGRLTVMLNAITVHDHQLLYGDGSEQLPGATASQRTAFLGPDGLSNFLETFILAGRVVAAPNSDPMAISEAIELMQSELQGSLAEAFERTVSVYGRNAHHQETVSDVLGPTILGLTLLAIIAEGPLIFAPMSRRIRSEVRRLAEAEAHQRFEADHDSLTGLVNRRHLSGLATAYEADGIDYVLMICDIDHFKAVNDTLGHDVGDQVLLAFAAVLRRTAEGLPSRTMPANSSLGGKPADIVAGRLGGDEFLVVLPLAGLGDAPAVFETVRRALPAELASLGLPLVTTSWGVASGTTARPWSVALKRADDALYLAKQRGRNTMASEAESDGVVCG